MTEGPRGPDTSPLKIVSQSAADGNIPELDCCGETVGIIRLSLYSGGKLAKDRDLGDLAEPRKSA